MFSSNLEDLKIQKFPSPLAPTMVGPVGDTELSKSLHTFFANRFLILNWNPGQVTQLLNLYTESVRKNHSLRMLGAIIQMAPLFYLFCHPKYQQLHLQDFFQCVQMPQELREYQEQNESFTVSCKTNCGQGADLFH